MHKFFRVESLHALHAVQSNFVKPKTLAWVRTMLAVYALLTLLVKLVFMAESPISYVMYITNFSYYSLVVYFMISAYLSWRFVLDPDSFAWQGYHWGVRFPYFLLYQTTVATSFIVGIVYWGLLARKELPQSTALEVFFSVSMHGINMILAGCEVYLSLNPFIITHVLLYLPLLLLYVPLSHIIHYYTDKWAYFFLDYNEEPIFFSCFMVGIVVLVIGLHCALTKLHTIRNRHNKFNFPESDPSICEKS
ncbi:hypothetical protein DSO57_1039368 [Entomophthora muscae]|uniref:Uncharacterized protein n=1 Tax=Entomophthora muscae TaxID=34485 RepID=A0ACC2UIV9_9FUNG|nr:hypothetical protein DSO57_1039368 [Entomophthora muscae]